MKDDRISFISHSSAFDTAGVYKIRFDSLCGMDGRESFSTAIGYGYSKTYQMVHKKILAGIIQKILVAY